jgi:hypothetical protein
VELIDQKTLVTYMQFRRVSVRGLAEAAKCNRSVVGHLRSGKRKTCKPDVAAAIERALNTPPGSLFSVPGASIVSRDDGRVPV